MQPIQSLKIMYWQTDRDIDTQTGRQRVDHSLNQWKRDTELIVTFLSSFSFHSICLVLAMHAVIYTFTVHSHACNMICHLLYKFWDSLIQHVSNELPEHFSFEKRFLMRLYLEISLFLYLGMHRIGLGPVNERILIQNKSQTANYTRQQWICQGMISAFPTQCNSDHKA